MRLTPERADSADARVLLGAYFDELRALVPAFDPARSVSADPDEMTSPHGVFLVARAGDAAIACGGLKTHAPGVGEVKRMFVVRDARGRGVGRALLAALEGHARALGMARLVLDTAEPLESAARLYRAGGYVEIAPYNDNPFAARWFAKDLDP